METIQVNGWVVFALVGGWVITTAIAIIGALPQLKRFRSQNAKDQADTASTYQALADKAGSQAAEAIKRADEANVKYDKVMLAIKGPHSIYAEFEMEDLIRDGRADLKNAWIELVKVRS